MLSRKYLVPCYSKLVHFFKLPFRGKPVLSFALLYKCNVNNSTEKVKVYSSTVFYDED